MNWNRATELSIVKLDVFLIFIFRAFPSQKCFREKLHQITSLLNLFFWPQIADFYAFGKPVRDLPVEDIVNLFPNVGPETQELSVDSVENRLEEVSLARVLAVEQLQQLQPHKVHC